jgi:hypothetical protein
MRLTILFFSLSFFCIGQEVLMYGNSQVNFHEELILEVRRIDSIVQNELDSCDLLLIFSTGNSRLSEEEQNLIVDFVTEGGSLYLGAENFPFNEECNQLSERFLQLKGYGNFVSDSLMFSADNSLDLIGKPNFESGISTISFPMDFRTKVIAWSNDNPIIISAEFGKGKIILDGGYSRFYNEENRMFFEIILTFLKGH